MNTKKLFNVAIVKKFDVKSLESQQIHYTWASILNGAELYATQAPNGKDVELLFKRGKALVRFIVTKEYAREHLKIAGKAENEEGKEISKLLDEEMRNF